MRSNYRLALVSRSPADIAQLTFEAPYQAHSPTSHQAARQISQAAPPLRERVLECIRDHGPVTDEEIAVRTRLNPSTARPRRVELVAAGEVMAAPETKRTQSGRRATAWIVARAF